MRGPDPPLRPEHAALRWAPCWTAPAARAGCSPRRLGGRCAGGRRAAWGASPPPRISVPRGAGLAASRPLRRSRRGAVSRAPCLPRAATPSSTPCGPWPSCSCAMSHVARLVEDDARPLWGALSLLVEPYTQALFLGLVGASLVHSRQAAVRRGDPAGAWAGARSRMLQLLCERRRLLLGAGPPVAPRAALHGDPRVDRECDRHLLTGTVAAWRPCGPRPSRRPCAPWRGCWTPRGPPAAVNAGTDCCCPPRCTAGWGRRRCWPGPAGGAPPPWPWCCWGQPASEARCGWRSKT